jgi:transaldolase
VLDAAKAGAHVATMPFSVLEMLVRHPLTDIGLKKFLDDWSRSGARDPFATARAHGGILYD